MASSLNIFLLFFAIKESFTQTPDPIINVHSGTIQGTYRESFTGRTYSAYEGIPYAVPPLGKRRFEPPEPIREWRGNMYARELAPHCTQYLQNPSRYIVTGDEDCLYLNIYVPVNPKSLPVLFIIHSGAFQYGRVPRDVKFLMDKDIIVVSINYRLGIFGFLSTEDEHIPGNMGLKDQSLALKWVYKNIKYFGGDTNRITLLGFSSGGASVHYHYMSPMSKGLFQSGISFSSSATGPSKHTANSREKSKKLATFMDCTTKSIPKMISCLKSISAVSLARATRHFMPWLYNPFTPFGPVVETAGRRPFINRTVQSIINSGDVADVLWIASTVNEEGLYPAAEFINDDELLKDLDKNWEEIAPHLLDYYYTIPLAEHAEVAKKIRNHYLGSKPINKNTVKELIKLIGNRLYTYDIGKAVRQQARVNKSPVFMMYYGYRANTSSSDVLSRSTNNYGVAHGDDYNLLFSLGQPGLPYPEEDRAMQVKMIDYVHSVASKGFPDFNLNFEWEAVDPSKEKTNFLRVLSPSDIRMSSDDNIGDEKFWSTIDFNENKV